MNSIKQMNRFISALKQLPEIQFVVLFLCTTFFYTIIIGLQGFDMVDEGWVVTAYQQLFDHPLSAEYQFLYYNSILVGALWNVFFGKLGLIGFRLLSSICTVLVAFISYELLKQRINRWAIFLGIMMILFSHHYILVFHHNMFTALICCLSALCLYHALIRRSNLCVFLAGTLIGINIFSRLPNMSMLSLSLVLFPLALYTKNVKLTLKMLLWGVIGVFFGIGINCFLLKCLGHWDIFVNNITSGLSAACANDSTHNLSNIINVYVNNYITEMKQIAILFLCPASAYFCNKWFPQKKLSRIIIVIITIFYFVLAWKLSEQPYTLYAFAYTLMAIYSFRHIDREHDIYLVSIAVIIMFFLPFGSDGGIGNMGPNCLWIGFPLALGLLFKLFDELKKYKTERKIAIAMFLTMALSISASDLYSTSLGCYFDNGSRLKKRTAVNHPLANTFTNRYKCDIVNEMLANLNKFVGEKDYLLCWQSVPMVHYLTNTYPYLNTSWPWVYDSENLKRQFIRAKEDISCLPVILCNKSSISCWFMYDSHWDSENADDQWNFNTKKAQVFHKFIEDNMYITVWENELFRIMLPGGNSDINNRESSSTGAM